MSRYASAGLSGSARSPRARREEASSRKRSRRSGSRPARARVAAIVLVAAIVTRRARSEEHTSELQSRFDLVCRLLLEKKKMSDQHSAVYYLPVQLSLGAQVGRRGS